MLSKFNSTMGILKKLKLLKSRIRRMIELFHMPVKGFEER